MSIVFPTCPNTGLGIPECSCPDCTSRILKEMEEAERIREMYRR